MQQRHILVQNSCQPYSSQLPSSKGATGKCSILPEHTLDESSHRHLGCSQITGRSSAAHEAQEQLDSLSHESLAQKTTQNSHSSQEILVSHRRAGVEEQSSLRAYDGENLQPLRVGCSSSLSPVTRALL